jgi:hypothetical protein
MNQAFPSIIQRSPHLEEAVSLLATVQFLVNPLEIMAAIFRSIKLAEEFVRQNRLANRFGEFVSMFASTNVAKGQLAFDDFFPLYCLIFASAAPSNAAAISALLFRLAGISIPAAFECGRMFFASAVEYVEAVDSRDLHLEPIDEDADPLGLLRR